MESNQQPIKAKTGVTGVFNLVPAGVLQRKRKYIAARFPFGPPSFSQAEFLLGVDPQNAAASKQRNSAQAAAGPPPALLLASKAQQTTPGSSVSSKQVQLQGVPRTDAGNNYFVLMKAGRDFCVYPLDASYTFKQLVRPSAMTIEEVEAAQRAPAAAAAAAAAAEAKMLLPKSLRHAMREEAAAEAADKQLKEEATTLPLLKDKVAELAAKYEGGSSKLVLHADEDEDEGSDDDMGDLEDEDAGAARRRSRVKAKKEADAAASKGKGKGKKGTPAAPDIPEDELAEDIYAGEEDELRPAAPGEAVDWEFDEAPADDDLEMGASDEEGLEDDPGYRKQLGLEGDEEEEEEKAKREAELAADAAGEPTAPAASADGAAAATDDVPAVEGEGEAADAADVDDDDDFDVADEEEFDADALDRLAAESENALVNPALKRRKQSAAAAARDRSPAPAAAMRGATPPTAAGAAAAATSRGNTPLGTAAAKRAATPPSASTVAAAGRGASSRMVAAAGGPNARLTPPPQGAAAAGQRLTPPPQAGNGSKRKRDAAGEGPSFAGAAAAAAAAASSGQGFEQAAWNWTAEQLDGQGVPTTDGIIAALSAMGPIPTERLQLLQDRLNLAAIGNDGKTLLKKRLLQVAKVGVIDGRKYMVLK